MRKVNLIVLAVVAIYLLAAPLALGQGGNPPASTRESGQTSGKGMSAAEQTGKDGGNAEQQIKQVFDQIVAAQLKVDTNSLEKLLADDYTAIYANGSLFTKAQEIENFKSGAIKDEILDVHDPKTRVAVQATRVAPSQ